MQLKLFMIFLLIIPGLSGIAYGHTVDAVGEYRVEIGWMNEPVVSGETNAIEFYIYGRTDPSQDGGGKIYYAYSDKVTIEVKCGLE